MLERMSEDARGRKEKLQGDIPDDDEDDTAQALRVKTAGNGSRSEEAAEIAPDVSARAPLRSPRRIGRARTWATGAPPSHLTCDSGKRARDKRNKELPASLAGSATSDRRRGTIRSRAQPVTFDSGGGQGSRGTPASANENGASSDLDGSCRAFWSRTPRAVKRPRGTFVITGPAEVVVSELIASCYRALSEVSIRGELEQGDVLPLTSSDCAGRLTGLGRRLEGCVDSNLGAGTKQRVAGHRAWGTQICSEMLDWCTSSSVRVPGHRSRTSLPRM